MKTKIYIVSLTKHVTDGNILYNDTKVFACAEDANRLYEHTKVCIKDDYNAYFEDDNDGTEERDGNCATFKIERNGCPCSFYQMMVKLQEQEIEIPTCEDCDDLSEPETEPVKMGVMKVYFQEREVYERAKTVYDSTGPSAFWAGDWNDELRMIEFAEPGELDALELALTDDMEHFGLTGYHFEGEVMWA